MYHGRGVDTVHTAASKKTANTQQREIQSESGFVIFVPGRLLGLAMHDAGLPHPPSPPTPWYPPRPPCGVEPVVVPFPAPPVVSLLWWAVHPHPAEA